ncbi:uncharacterized protein LOC143832551 [Paroedura picta]|uniref:uncharacterized protein LOC143832551 n=1 Tax=Paroedura picta TaxID=143630 RepID=UPI004057BDD5
MRQQVNSQKAESGTFSHGNDMEEETPCFFWLNREEVLILKGPKAMMMMSSVQSCPTLSDSCTPVSDCFFQLVHGHPCIGFDRVKPADPLATTFPFAADHAKH